MVRQLRAKKPTNSQEGATGGIEARPEAVPEIGLAIGTVPKIIPRNIPVFNGNCRHYQIFKIKIQETQDSR